EPATRAPVTHALALHHSALNPYSLQHSKASGISCKRRQSRPPTIWPCVKLWSYTVHSYLSPMGLLHCHLQQHCLRVGNTEPLLASEFKRALCDLLPAAATHRECVSSSMTPLSKMLRHGAS